MNLCLFREKEVNASRKLRNVGQNSNATQKSKKLSQSRSKIFIPNGADANMVSQNSIFTKIQNSLQNSHYIWGASANHYRMTIFWFHLNFLNLFFKLNSVRFIFKFKANFYCYEHSMFFDFLWFRIWHPRFRFAFLNDDLWLNLVLFKIYKVEIFSHQNFKLLTNNKVWIEYQMN